MKNGTRIFLICLIVILLLGYVVGFAYCTYNKYAYAEYKDLTATDVVSFNQYLQITTVANGIEKINDYGFYNNTFSSGYFAANIQPISFIAGHKYYLKGNNNYRLYFSGGATQIFDSIMDNQTTRTSSQIFTNTYITGTFYFAVIDLTQMFGNNTPNLEQCKELFISDYYAYNTGAMMFYGVNGYAFQQEIDFKINTGNLAGYPQNVTQTTVSYDENSKLILSAVQQPNYAGYYLINLKTNVPIGSIVTLNFNSYVNNSGSAWILATNNNEDLITDIPRSSAYNQPFTYSFRATEDFSSLYLLVDYYDTGTVLTIEDWNINIRFPDDYAVQYQLQYDLGYQDAQEYYTTGYGRQTIWSEGFTAGKAKGLQEANGSFEAMDYVKAAFVTIGEILMIEVFPNFTLGAFFLLPIITSAILFIMKISKGG